MTNQLLAELEMLQQTKDKLQNDYQNAVDKINELQQENKQLKKKYENAVADYDYEKCKNNQAIEYIVKNCILSDEWTELDFCNFIPTGKITYKQLTPKKVKELLKILGDKENE